jgi:hypothetical protein
MNETGHAADWDREVLAELKSIDPGYANRARGQKSEQVMSLTNQEENDGDSFNGIFQDT